MASAPTPWLLIPIAVLISFVVGNLAFRLVVLAEEGSALDIGPGQIPGILLGGAFSDLAALSRLAGIALVAVSYLWLMRAWLKPALVSAPRRRAVLIMIAVLAFFSPGQLLAGRQP